MDAPEKTSSTSPPLRVRIGVFLALLLIAAVPLVPVLFSPLFPPTHESLRYEQLTMLFADAIRNGSLYPRWLPDLAGGHGYPTFIFYQPLVFWVGSLVSWTGLPPVSWTFHVDYLFFALGAGGAYRLARLFCPRATALAAAMLYVLTPYLFVNLHIRGDHSELAANLLLPWPLWAMIRIQRLLREGRRTIGVALIGGVSIAAIVMAHPIPAIIAIPLLGLTFLAQTFTIARPLRGAWVRVGLSVCAIGLALSLPYWFCVWQFQSIVHLDRTIQDYFRAEYHLIPWNELLSMQWRFGVSDGATTPMGQMSLPLGIAHALLAVAGIIAARNSGWVRCSAIIYAVLILMMTPGTQGIWANESFPLRSIQFPWRMLGVLAAFQFLLVLGLMAKARSPWVAFAIVLLVAGTQWRMFRVSPFPFQGEGYVPRYLAWSDADNIIRVNVRDMHVNYETFANVHEFDPVWMREPPEPLGDTPLISSLGKVTMLPESTRYRIAASVVSEKPSGALLHQIYFPGWNIAVNGTPIDDDTLRSNVMSNGTILIPIPAGQSTITAHYDGPPGGTMRLVISLATLILSLVVIVRADRLIRGTTPSPQTPETAPAPSHSPPAAGA